MPLHPFARLGIMRALGQGEATPVRSGIASLTRDPLPAFMQVFVLEVISDPKKVTKEKVDYWNQIFKLGISPSSNFESGETDTRVFPRNTIIAQRKLSGNTKVSPPMFLLPFFPSHLAMPCKPGELVWAIYENPEGSRDIGYWICSVVQPNFIDDVNHSFMPMGLRKDLPPNAKPEDFPFQLRNGLTYLTREENASNKFAIRVDEKSRLIADDREDIFERLVSGDMSDAGNLMQYEKIPRFHKRPGDLAIEGSNNSLIVLGTDRLSSIANYEQKKLDNTTEGIKLQNISRGLVPLKAETDNESPNLTGETGCIDMVAGRGYTPEKGGKPLKVVSVNNTQDVIKEELDKLNPPAEEGDIDPISDRSRVLIAQRNYADQKFNLGSYFEKNIKDVKPSSNGDASVVIKSDKIRLIARSDISLVVTSYTEKNDAATLTAEGIKFPYKTEEIDTKKWASITITSKGDIIFTPSEQGLIKLGGEDADKAILCTDNLAPGAAGKPVVNNGKVSYKPGLISSGADLVGTGKPKQGTFATKILVK